MRKRTTVWQVVRLAWRLIVTLRHHRKHLRIGQMLSNYAGIADIFYVENDELVDNLHSAAREPH